MEDTEMREIRIVTRGFLNQLLNSPGETYEPRGRFVCPEEIDGVVVWTAINNIDGEADTEEFYSRNSAARWLHGFTAHNIYGESVKIETGGV